MASCCFTGHRDLSDSEFNRAYTEALQTIEELYDFFGVDVFMTGGAIGFDTAVSEALSTAKENGMNIKMILAVPCADQDKYWNSAAKKEYRRIKEHCDKIMVLSEEYHNGCMLERNRFMVDNTDYCVAFLRKNTITGGTLYTVRYACEKNKKVINICKV